MSNPMMTIPVSEFERLSNQLKRQRCAACQCTLGINPICIDCFAAAEEMAKDVSPRTLRMFADRADQLGDRIRDNRGEPALWWAAARDLAVDLRKVKGE